MTIDLEGLPATMKAARLLNPVFVLHASAALDEHKYTIQDLPIPRPQSREILLRVQAAGYCHTDSIMPIGDFGGPLPITGSHEPAGIIVAMDAEVEAMGKFKVGDRVMAVNTARACRKCAMCLHHDDRFCPTSAEIGLKLMDGAFAEYCLVDAKYAVVIPDEISWEQAAPLSCAGVTVWHSIKRTGLKPGQILGISGVGALGLLGVQMARATGLKVVGIDGRDQPLKLAASKEHAPDLIINAANTPSEEALKQIDALRDPGWTGGSGVDAIVMCTNAAPALPYALSIIKPFSTIVMTAGPMEPAFHMYHLVFRGLTVVGDKNGTGEDLQEVADICVKYGIRSEVRPYELTEESLDRLISDTHSPEWSGKAVVLINPEKANDS